MKILITGGAGFIGSNFVNLFVDAVDKMVCVDNLGYAGKMSNFTSAALVNPKFSFIREDINNTAEIINIIKTHEIDCIIHMAAESHVDNSINSPLTFIHTNAVGTGSMLEAARVAWLDFTNKIFIYVSTDEVYGSTEHGSFTESSPYKPNSPYSASKAAGDMLCRAYYETYKLPVIVTHCSNNYGDNQHSEKFIPTVINSIKSCKQIPIYGNGLNVRNWIHVTDHCRGIMLTAVLGKQGETYNFGGDVELTNIEVIKTICKILNVDFDKSTTFVTDRKGHDFRYSVDSSKSRNELRWRALIPFDTGVRSLIANATALQ